MLYYTTAVLVPGLHSGKNPSQLAKAFINVHFQGRKFSHFVAIDVTGLDVKFGRPGVFVIPNSNALDLTNRIVGSGKVQVPATAPKPGKK